MTHPVTLLVSVLAAIFLSACGQSSNEIQSPSGNTGAVASGKVVGHTTPSNPFMEYLPYSPDTSELLISREDYSNKLYGFWLGQCIANWTGLVTEMDKIGGEGPPQTHRIWTALNVTNPPSFWLGRNYFG